VAPAVPAFLVSGSVGWPITQVRSERVSRGSSTKNHITNVYTDKTRQFCLVSTQFPISKFSVILNIFQTEPLQVGNWVETRQTCLVLSLIVFFTPPTPTRQFCLVRLGGVNKHLHCTNVHFIPIGATSCQISRFPKWDGVSRRLLDRKSIFTTGTLRSRLCHHKFVCRLSVTFVRPTRD